MDDSGDVFIMPVYMLPIDKLPNQGLSLCSKLFCRLPTGDGATATDSHTQREMLVLPVPRVGGSNRMKRPHFVVVRFDLIVCFDFIGKVFSPPGPDRVHVPQRGA